MYKIDAFRDQPISSITTTLPTADGFSNPSTGQVCLLKTRSRDNDPFF